MKVFTKLAIPLAFLMATTACTKEETGPLHAKSYTTQLQKEAVPIGNAHFNRMIAAGEAAKLGDCTKMDQLLAESRKAFDTSAIPSAEEKAKQDYKNAFAVSELDPFLDQAYYQLIQSNCNGPRKPNGTAAPIAEYKGARL